MTSEGVSLRAAGSLCSERIQALSVGLLERVHAAFPWGLRAKRAGATGLAEEVQSEGHA